jgi:nitrate/nitrite-specific signal transduction histidine kinase
MLSVSDDGVGISGDSNYRDGVGFRLMRYRASLIGGVLQIRNGDGQGTLVTCTLSKWRRMRPRSDASGAAENKTHSGNPA